MGKYIDRVKKNCLTVFRSEYTWRLFLESIWNTFRNNFSNKTLTQKMFLKKKNLESLENILEKTWKKEERHSYYLNCTKRWVTSPTFYFSPSWIKQLQISTSGMEYDENVANQYTTKNCCKENLFQNLLK